MGRWSTGVSVGGSVTYDIGSARRIAAARKNGAERGIVHTRLRSEEKWIWLFTRRLLADGREQFAVRNDSTVQLICHKIPSPGPKLLNNVIVEQRPPNSPISKSPAPMRNSSAKRSSETACTKLANDTDPVPFSVDISRCSIGVASTRRGESISRTTVPSALALTATSEFPRLNGPMKSFPIFRPEGCTLVMARSGGSFYAITNFISRLSAYLHFFDIISPSPHSADASNQCK